MEMEWDVFDNSLDENNLLVLSMTFILEILMG